MIILLCKVFSSFCFPSVVSISSREAQYNTNVSLTNFPCVVILKNEYYGSHERRFLTQHDGNANEDRQYAASSYSLCPAKVRNTSLGGWETDQDSLSVPRRTEVDRTPLNYR